MMFVFKSCGNPTCTCACMCMRVRAINEYPKIASEINLFTFKASLFSCLASPEGVRVFCLQVRSRTGVRGKAACGALHAAMS